jgi:peptide/nickel transport system substrate-binding protein
VVDRYKVDFALDKPSAIFPETLALFFPVEKAVVLANVKLPGNYGDLGDYGEDWLSTHDAGTGPYRMVSHIPGQRLEAARFLDYFDGWSDEGCRTRCPSAPMFIARPATPPMNLLKSGGLDLEINGGWTLPQLGQIESDPALDPATSAQNVRDELQGAPR